jgi:hypothetical protein
MIVFAKTSIEAKRDWANEHGDGDPDGAPHRTDDPQIIALMARCGSV